MTLKIIEINNIDEITESKLEENPEQILLVPNSGWREEKGALYPSESADFKKHINQNSEYKAEFVSEPTKLLSLNSFDAFIPLVVLSAQFVQNIGIKVIVGLIVSYLQNKYTRIFEDSNSNVKFTLKIKGKKKSLDLEYDGPASEINSTFTPEKVSEIMSKL
ncbi:hypothetical protein HQ533_01590 [Candidatus Woesearchaeota archaeon]|nr:hypothetical protein [Candidatus Woesearchaeota archaeon]